MIPAAVDLRERVKQARRSLGGRGMVLFRRVKSSGAIKCKYGDVVAEAPTLELAFLAAEGRYMKKHSPSAEKPHGRIL